MRLSVTSSALAAAFVLTPVVAGYAPALGQDFSITNQMEPANPWHRDVMRRLQAWWDAHAYYPRHASNTDEGGTVKIHLVILPDGRIWTINVVKSSGSRTIDTAGDAVFRGGAVGPARTPGEPNADIDISLHYVLAHRHDQKVAAGDTPVASRSPFTITNDPVKSPILETMAQRTCTGTMTKNGIPNHPIYGMRGWMQLIFFRKPDGTPWVKFNEFGYPGLSPVTEIGKMLTWTGPHEYGRGSAFSNVWLQFTVWADGDNHLSGTVGSRVYNSFGVAMNDNVGGSVDLTCATQVLPAVTVSGFWGESAQSVGTSPLDLSSPDPP